jgi:signal transduction histidine kinase
MTRHSNVHRFLLFAALLTLVAATVLVVTLQRNAERHQREQNAQIIDQLCWQTAMLVRQRLRDNFGAAVSETIEGIGHPELHAYDLPRIARYFDSGRAHIYVNRYFIWSDRMKPLPREEVLFYRQPGNNGNGGEAVAPDATEILAADGKRLGSLYRSSLGRVIWSRAMDLLPLKRSFAVVDEQFEGRQLQLIIHYLWFDAARTDLDVILGYSVDFTELRERKLPAVLQGGLAGMAGTVRPELDITILDELNRPVVGKAPPAGARSASVPLEMLFMAKSMQPFRANEPTTPPWIITVSAATPVAAGAGSTYWLFAAVVFLILMGLVCALALDRQGRKLAAMQSEFIAHVSHQLKTPLALLSGAAETLGRGRVTSAEKIREYAGIVHAQSSRLSALVEQAIIFSVADVDGAGLRFDVVDATEVVRDAVEGFKRGVPKELPVRFRAQDGVPLVKADPSALEQVVWNLMENAVKYGQEGNAIDVAVSSSARQVVVTVSDRGEGITPQDLPKIFDRFYRGRGNGHQRRGFGLGLAYVQKVVIAHRGSISVNSEPGRGSEFRVYLPAA